MKYYSYVIYPDSVTICNISMKTKSKQTNHRSILTLEYPVMRYYIMEVLIGTFASCSHRKPEFPRRRIKYYITKVLTGTFVT
jgi:predicted transcriptional regulator with HTH domain